MGHIPPIGWCIPDQSNSMSMNAFVLIAKHYSMNSLIGSHSILSGVIGGQLKSGLREKGAGKGVSLNSAGEGLTPIHSRPFRRKT